MKKIGLVLLFISFAFFVLSFSLSSYAQEEITFITYYPAPYGVYQEIQVGQTGHFMTLDYDAANTCHRIVGSGDNIDDIMLSPNGTASYLVVDGVDGNVGIGTREPGTRNLQISDVSSNVFCSLITSPNNQAWFMFGDTDNDGMGAVRYRNDVDSLDLYVNQGTRLTITSNGNVGIGTTDPHATLDIKGWMELKYDDDRYVSLNQMGQGNIHYKGINVKDTFYISNEYTGGDSPIQIGSALTARGKGYFVRGIRAIGDNHYGIESFTNSTAHYAGVFHSNDNNSARRGVGVYGYIRATGTINGSTDVDIAEWIKIGKEEISCGDVVVIDKNQSERIIKSHSAYSSNVAGIISTQPGFILGYSEEGKEDPLGATDQEMEEMGFRMLSIAGRAPCKVTTENGPIKPGDLLTTSSVSGHAMKAKPIGEVNGHPIYPQGCIVGKALEGLKEGKGKILVLVCLM